MGNPTAPTVEPHSPPRSVGGAAVSGALWTVALAALYKVVALGVQVVLAWLLVPSELGLANLALSSLGMLSIFLGGVLQKVLIQTQETFDKLAGPVFWLALTMNTAAGLSLALAAPTLAEIFHEPSLLPQILVVACAPPLSALWTVHCASLYLHLRFREVALMHLGEGVIQSTASVLLAWSGAGAYALSVPPLLSTCFSVVVCRVLAGRISLGRPDPKGWPSLLKPTLWLTLNSGFAALQSYGANLVLGWFQTPAAVGLYAWGFSLSAQVVVLLSRSLNNVFFPALSRLGNDEPRLQEAFRKTSQTILLVIVPVCVLQAVVAPSVIRLLFHPRWLPAAPVVQWLSLGVLLQPLAMLAEALLMARGSFVGAARRSGLLAVTVVVATAFAARAGDQATVAKWAGITLFLGHLATVSISVYGLGPSWGRHVASGLSPLLTGIPLLLAGKLISHAVSKSPIVEIALAMLAVFSFQILLAGLFWRPVTTDFLRRVREALAGRRQRAQRSQSQGTRA